MSFLEQKIEKQRKGNQAANIFHKAPNFFNCAQSILKTFQKEFKVEEIQIKDFKRYGGGRAQDGYCGALFAGMQLLKDQPELQNKLEKHFTSTTGSPKCSDIRGKRKLPCRKLVELTANLVEELQDK
ncbi:MAG: C-GCAxxG-C-C family (seleno)protein [Marinifilaceae bacterium]